MQLVFLCDLNGQEVCGDVYVNALHSTYFAASISIFKQQQTSLLVSNTMDYRSDTTMCVTTFDHTNVPSLINMHILSTCYDTFLIPLISRVKVRTHNVHQ